MLSTSGELDADADVMLKHDQLLMK